VDAPAVFPVEEELEEGVEGEVEDELDEEADEDDGPFFAAAAVSELPQLSAGVSDFESDDEDDSTALGSIGAFTGPHPAASIPPTRTPKITRLMPQVYHAPSASTKLRAKG
jgi:hypothetical protein